MTPKPLGHCVARGQDLQVCEEHLGGLFSLVLGSWTSVWCSLPVGVQDGYCKSGVCSNGVDCGRLGDMEVLLSQKHTVADKGNERLIDQSLHSSLKLETLL